MDNVIEKCMAILSKHLRKILCLRMEGKHLRFWQWIVFGVLWLAYGSTYLLRKPLGVIKADLESGLNVSSAILGWVDTALLLPYAAVSLTLGSVGDRLGSRVTLA